MVEIQSILAYFKYKQAASVSCSLNRLQDAVRYVIIGPYYSYHVFSRDLKKYRLSKSISIVKRMNPS